MKLKSANQAVAFNLKRARERAGLTQEQAAELLEPYLGVRWSKSTFSAAERSAEEGTRAREFTADEIMAFVAGFELPVAYFMLPDIEPDKRTALLVADKVRFVLERTLGSTSDTVARLRQAADELERLETRIAREYGEAAEEVLSKHVRDAI